MEHILNYLSVANIDKVSSCLKAAIFSCKINLNNGLNTFLIKEKCINTSCDEFQELTVKDILYQTNR